MRSGAEGRYQLHLEMLEDRTTPGAVLPLEAGPVLATLHVAGQTEGGAPAVSSGRSLTLAVVTEAHPMPVDVSRPGIPPAPPFQMDPAGIVYLVSYQLP